MQWAISNTWINSALGEWISSLVRDATFGELSVTFGAPGPDGGPAARPAQATRGLNLHLLTIAPHSHATVRTERRAESQLVLRYLITSWAEHGEVADALLCTLAFRLLERGANGPDGQSEVTVETAPSLELLKALGVAPRPALIAALPLVHVDEPAPARWVMHPPIVRVEAAEALWGTVVGIENRPIAAALVEFPALGLVTETDPDGRFRFARVPVDTTGQTLRVRARGRECIFQLSAMEADRSVTLQMTFGEEA